jgi:hypothetical protein
MLNQSGHRIPDNPGAYTPVRFSCMRTVFAD